MGSRAKNNRRGTTSRQSSGPRSVGTRAKTDDLVREAAELASKEEESATAEGVPTVSNEDEPDITTDGEASARTLREALAAAVKARELADRRRRQWDEAHERLAKDRDALIEEQSALRERKTELTTGERELGENRASLNDREEALAEQRREAESGFAALREARLTKLEEDLDRLRSSWEERRTARITEFEQHLSAREEAAAVRLAHIDAKLTAREREVALTEADLVKRESVLRRTETLASAHEHVLLQQETDQRMALETEYRTQFDQLRHELADWKVKFDGVDRISRQRGEEILALRSASGILGKPEQAAEELLRLRLENERLQQSANAVSPLDRERYDYLVRRCEELEAERAELVRRNAELQRTAALNRISVADRETNRLVNDSLNARNTVLRAENEALQMTISQFQERKEGQSPFQECTRMDVDTTLQTSPQMPSGAPALADLVHRVAHRIALSGRYFSAHDLRCFLAGLAMSRLHLLQGISGIGKTSLPRDFAAAVGADCVVVPVAAEWRSPQDLMGYYNPFERRFYESAFTRALYQAQQPLHENKPFLIVLDEMNLSHPEQYFSDVLHVLELTRSTGDEKLLLELMTGRVDPAPRKLENGHKLVIPDNVWFIGTANQDETTVAFADKTYDRAHIIELPARPDHFKVEEVRPISPFSTRAMSEQFAKAENRYTSEAELVQSFLDDLVDHTRSEFGITAGSRVGRQLARFVPVMVAAGGSAGEAADHLIATKLLRKLHGRVEIREDRLKSLREHLELEWTSFDGDPWTPQQSLALIDSEIRDRGGW